MQVPAPVIQAASYLYQLGAARYLYPHRLQDNLSSWTALLPSRCLWYVGCFPACEDSGLAACKLGEFKCMAPKITVKFSARKTQCLTCSVPIRSSAPHQRFFSSEFGESETRASASPGRARCSGNATDHATGHVIGSKAWMLLP
jgi:hypothetical protein